MTDSKGREAYSDHGGGHIGAALDFLLSARPEAQWKTAGQLTTLRQAFREDSANCRTEEMDMLPGRGPAPKPFVSISPAPEAATSHTTANTPSEEIRTMNTMLYVVDIPSHPADIGSAGVLLSIYTKNSARSISLMKHQARGSEKFSRVTDTAPFTGPPSTAT